MIISHKHKFIFIKTRKTAGTSIEIALSQFCNDGDIITTLNREDEDIRRELGFRGPQNYNIPFKFRRLATYSPRDWLKVFLRRKPYPHIQRHADAHFAQAFLGETIWNEYYKFCFERNPYDRAISRYYWQTREENQKPDINEYIQSNKVYMLSNWSKYTINNRIVVDFVGKYESLNEDLAMITQKIGLPSIALPTAKADVRQNRQHYSKILNHATKAHIDNLCAGEIEMFGYTWNEL